MVNPGEEIAKGLSSEEMRFVQTVETPEGKGLLLRPVEEYTIPNEAQLPELSHVVTAPMARISASRSLSGSPSRTAN